MGAIFISYRRDDAEGQAGRLYGDLVKQFGKDAVFMDVVALEVGRDFRQKIVKNVASCNVLLAIIGKDWIDAKDDKQMRRLDDINDFVRLEIGSALKRDIPVIPVLVRGASMPRAEQLPPDCQELSYRNGVELTHARWDSDVQILIKALSTYVSVDPKDASSMKHLPEAGNILPRASKVTLSKLGFGLLAGIILMAIGVIFLRPVTVINTVPMDKKLDVPPNPKIVTPQTEHHIVQPNAAERVVTGDDDSTASNGATKAYSQMTAEEAWHATLPGERSIYAVDNKNVAAAADKLGLFDGTWTHTQSRDEYQFQQGDEGTVTFKRTVTARSEQIRDSLDFFEALTPVEVYSIVAYHQKGKNNDTPVIEMAVLPRTRKFTVLLDPVRLTNCVEEEWAGQGSPMVYSKCKDEIVWKP